MSHTHRTHPLPQQSPGSGFSGGGGNSFDCSSNSLFLMPSVFDSIGWTLLGASSAMELWAWKQKGRGSWKRLLRMMIVLAEARRTVRVRSPPRLMEKPTWVWTRRTFSGFGRRGWVVGDVYGTLIRWFAAVSMEIHPTALTGNTCGNWNAHVVNLSLALARGVRILEYKRDRWNLWRVRSDHLNRWLTD